AKVGEAARPDDRRRYTRGVRGEPRGELVPGQLTGPAQLAEIDAQRLPAVPVQLGLVAGRARGEPPRRVGQRALGDDAEAGGAGALDPRRGVLVAQAPRQLQRVEPAARHRPVERVVVARVRRAADLAGAPGLDEGVDYVAAREHVDRARVQVDDLDPVGGELRE